MHMLGHEHESGQTMPMPGGRSIKTFREHRSPDIISQQRHSPVTTEGQFPNVTEMIKMTNLFSMGSALLGKPRKPAVGPEERSRDPW